MKKESYKISEETLSKLNKLKHELKLSSIEKSILHLLIIFENYKKIKRIGFTDEEKLKMLKEQGRRIVEEVEQLKNKQK